MYRNIQFSILLDIINVWMFGLAGIIAIDCGVVLEVTVTLFTKLSISSLSHCLIDIYTIPNTVYSVGEHRYNILFENFVNTAPLDPPDST